MRWDGGTLWLELSGQVTVPEGMHVCPGSAEAPDEYGQVSMLVLARGTVPDWVRLPAELGGQVARVTRSKTGPCVCGQHDTGHLVLEGDIGVCACPEQGYLWYRWAVDLARVCPGCRDLDGEHDYGRTCTLADGHDLGGEG